jgi:hypothetical protein
MQPATYDTMMKMGICINAGELIDIVRGEPNLRVSFEKRVLKRYAILVEPGIYFTGTGYNFKAEVKRYVAGRSKNKSQRTNYLGLAYGVKDHFYSEAVVYYKDSTHGPVENKKLGVEKQAYTADLLIGWIRYKKHFYLDGYVGVGVRWKNIGKMTKAEYDMMEDNIGRSFELIPGQHVLPDITMGLRVGFNLSRKRN